MPNESEKTTIEPEETLGSQIRKAVAERGYRPEHYAQLCQQAGVDRHTIDRITAPRPGTVIKLAEALRIGEKEREAWERAWERTSDHGNNKGFLRETGARPFPGLRKISMQRAILLLTAPVDPSPIFDTVSEPGTPWAKVARRSGVVFGWHDVVARVTTPENTSVLDYSQTLFQQDFSQKKAHKEQKPKYLRTVETIPVRDDMPIYLDKTFTTEHLAINDYKWATIFVQALGGGRDVEFPQIFYEVAEDRRFWGGLHLLTAAITVGQFDSVVEVLAANLTLLKNYVREAQIHAQEAYDREAHTITYFTTHLEPEPLVAEF